MAYERIDGVVEAFRKTLDVSKWSLKTYPGVFTGLTSLYLAVYLFMVNDLNIHPNRFGFEVRAARNPLGLMFRSSGTYSFEAVAAIELPFITVLVSPINILIGGVIAVLVGLNLTLTYASYRNPKMCSTRNVGGVLSALPALLTGSACCAPLIFIALGIQASATLLTAQRLLLPIAVAALVLSLPLAAKDIIPTSVGE